MKVTYTTANSRLSVEIEGDTQKKIFEQLAAFQEVFENTQCGKCQGENITNIVREVGGNSFYELRCLDCHARLSFGQHRQGDSLFPVRKAGENDKSGLEEGVYLPDGGWMRWSGAEGKTV
jgi:hypothetical protein